MEKWKFGFNEEDSFEIMEILMEEYHKGLIPLKNIDLLGVIDDKFYDDKEETKKKYKITIEVY